MSKANKIGAGLGDHREAEADEVVGRGCVVPPGRKEQDRGVGVASAPNPAARRAIAKHAADEALRLCARTVARVMLDLEFDESEAADAEQLTINGTAQQWRASILADVIEPGGVRFRLFVAHDDDHAKQLLELPSRNGASVSASCTLFDAVQSAWSRTWGELGKAKGPGIESY